MSGPSSSKSNTNVTTTTTTVSDSYNKTINKVANLSDVGNLSINLAGGGDSGGADIMKTLPLAIAGVIGIVAVAVIARK
jgi:hypothetical protein